jgi:hypothetical protein
MLNGTVEDSEYTGPIWIERNECKGSNTKNDYETIITDGLDIGNSVQNTDKSKSEKPISSSVIKDITKKKPIRNSKPVTSNGVELLEESLNFEKKLFNQFQGDVSKSKVVKEYFPLRTFETVHEESVFDNNNKEEENRILSSNDVDRKDVDRKEPTKYCRKKSHEVCFLSFASYLGHQYFKYSKIWDTMAKMLKLLH